MLHSRVSSARIGGREPAERIQRGVHVGQPSVLAIGANGQPQNLHGVALAVADDQLAGALGQADVVDVERHVRVEDQVDGSGGAGQLHHETRGGRERCRPQM